MRATRETKGLGRAGPAFGQAGAARIRGGCGCLLEGWDAYRADDARARSHPEDPRTGSDPIYAVGRLRKPTPGGAVGPG